MKIVFLDSKTIGDDIDLSEYEKLGEVVKYDFSTTEEAAKRTRDADVIVGPIGIMAADALLGEITESMASAVARSRALKILIPVNTCSFHVMGVGKYTMSELITEAVNHIKEAFEEK